MKKIKIISFCMAVAMFSATLTACGAGVNSNSSSQQGTADTSSQSVAEQAIINPFTGEDGYSEALLKTRPVAVMINNIAQALPQSGIADADIVYEMPVEGPITRLMAVFSDYKSMPNIGSIRSARHDYVELVKPINAIYLHFGGSQAGKQAISNNSIDDIDGIAMANTSFYKDKERAKTKSSEHCWFSNGKLLQAGIDKKGFDTSMEPMSTLFDFAKPEEDAMANYAEAKSATDVKLTITSATKASFTYDATTKTYSKSQNDKPHIDTNKNEPVKSTNVFLMYTTVGYLADNYHKEVEMSKGTGFYISNGKAIEVTFKKSSAKDFMKVYSSDGKEVKVNPGKSYFCIADNSQKDKLTIQ